MILEFSETNKLGHYNVVLMSPQEETLNKLSKILLFLKENIVINAFKELM